MTLILRNILFWGFVLCMLEMSEARPNPKICRKKNGRFPRPGTLCKGYYDCKRFVPEEKSCPDGEHFNANKERCDWDSLYPCLEKQKDKECPVWNGQFLKPGTKCKKYYQCCNGKATVKDCYGDALFDPSTSKCEWPDLYTCAESLSTTEKMSSTVTNFATSTSPDDRNEKTSTAHLISTSTIQQTSRLSTTEKTSSTMTNSATFTSPGDLSEKTSIDPFASTSTVQQTTTTNPITQFTHDPDFERTSSRIFQTSTEINTEPTPTDGRMTSQTSETSSISQPVTNEISTLKSTTGASTESSSISQPVTNEISTLKPTTGASTESSSISQPVTNEISTLKPTTGASTESSKMSTDSKTTSESSTSEIATGDISTSQPTTEILLSSSTTLETSTIPDVTSTHHPDHTFVKEDKEGDIIISTIFETMPPEVTTPEELNIMCPEPNGYFPHPTDKHKFVGCVGNIPSVLTCPSNLVYKHSLRRCDYE